ncbi:MAK10 isoform 2 [Hibiscus syriacus]|uniref:MAK10 isoform 2 n=1 Tax=Hibiscus syriacus TaxID=106335 RepID=A0A6A3BU09_HIBSY|nr:MAK10 isoform 2 [Hibiscus syriacus]
MKRPQGRGLESARKHISSCMTELESIQKSAYFIRSCFGESCEGDIDDKTTASGREPIGFDAMLNSRLSALMPPRTIKILSWKKAVEYFVKLLHDLDVICSYSLDPHLESLLRFVVQFQKSQPDLVARSHLQLLLVQDGKLYGRDPLFSVITKAAALLEATKNHDIQKNESILQLGMLVMNLLKILCTNAAWQRRKLGKFLQDWHVIYVQLELALRNEFGEVSSRSSNDENVCMKIFQHILLWVEEQTYWITFRFLILGFELELYSTSEYCMVYWYLYAVLIKLAEKTQLKMAVSYDTAKRKGKKKKDSPKDLARESRIPPAVTFLQCCIFLAEGLTMISVEEVGLRLGRTFSFQMLAALRNEISLFQSPGPFNTEQEKFAQHFELLQRACIPDHFSYPSYKESTTHARFSTLAMYNYFKDAQRIAKEVKSSFSNDPERLAELQKLEHVAEHNSAAQDLICRLGALDPSLKVSFELSHHPFFATVVAKRS